MRFGIEGNFERQVNYAIGEWTGHKKFAEKIKTACDAVKSFTTIGLERTMNFYNKIGNRLITLSLKL
jgi:PTH1 family peptidyl-tRNA hydrolase